MRNNILKDAHSSLINHHTYQQASNVRNKNALILLSNMDCIAYHLLSYLNLTPFVQHWF